MFTLGLGVTIPRDNFYNSSGGDGAPVNAIAPVVTGTTRVAQTLSVTTGIWTNDPLGFTYQWFRLVTYGGVAVTYSGLLVGVAIGGATANTYLLQPADYGEYIYCEVTATNGIGSTMAQSNVVGLVVGAGTALDATNWFILRL